MDTSRRIPTAVRSTRVRAGLAWLALVPLLVAAIALVSVLAAPSQGSSGRARVFPAELVMQVDPQDAGYTQPADAVEIVGALFVLDTGNNRILVQDTAGAVQRVIDGLADGQPLLKAPMAIASDGRYLYVANAGASEVLVLEPGGLLVRRVDLNPDAAAGQSARPVGVAVTAGGALVVSDPDHNRVLQLGAEGQLLRSLGGARASGTEGFSAPTGVATDGAGNLYVVDTLNGRVVKLSPDGAFLQQFGRPGDTAGTFSRPKDVAADASGNVYVSDGLLAAVQVFSPKGEYLGFIGRSDPDDPRSGSLFKAPAGISVSGNRLYVVDRFAGLLVFQLP